MITNLVPISVVYDACVLHSAILRSFLMHLADTKLYRAHWTNEIHEEWMRSVQKKLPQFTRTQGERIRDLMDRHVMDALVTGYEWRIPSLELPDPDDRHVLAAAIHCRANVIVTSNLRDFPATALLPFHIEARHPDEFIRNLLELSPEKDCEAAKEQRASLKRPPMTAEEYLTALDRQGLPQTVSTLREFVNLI